MFSMFLNYFTLLNQVPLVDIYLFNHNDAYTYWLQPYEL